MTPGETRHRLMLAGFSPIPVTDGTKRPAIEKAWQNKHETNDGEIELWSQLYPRANCTGILTRLVPTFDIDILNEEAAEAVEALVRERFEERGYILVRVGRAPKRAILFRTNDPFKKISVNFIASGGNEEKLEFLGDGQQVVVNGIHATTGQPYRWHGGEPGRIKREDLPYIHEAEARQLVEDAADLLRRDFGFKRAKARPKKEQSKSDPGNGRGSAVDDWGYLVENIRCGRALHDSLRDLAGKLVRAGMGSGAAINFLRGQLEAIPEAGRDQRWRERYADIPRLVESAKGPEDGATQKPDTDLAPSTIDETLAVFKRWLLLSDATPIYAVLGTVAANLLDGDPVWLGLVGPPSSAKTEILNATAMLPNIAQAATVTPAGLLSGTPKKQQDKGARGGLLRQIGDFGIIVLKDFGSVLSMRPDAKAETLAALREVYDGAWTRHLGTDGGKTLEWRGKVGLLFGATGVIDAHYSVIGQMGDRFLLSRLAPATKGQFNRALEHQGAATKQMRGELAEAVAHLFAGRRAEPRLISDDEINRIDHAISLVVRLRGAVDRDRNSREIEAVLGAEGTARIGLALERLLAGLDTLGVHRETALQVVEAVAMDSVPPLRRAAYKFLCGQRTLLGGYQAVATPDVAATLDLPTNTVRRALEDLAAYRLVERKSQGQGKADLWTANPPSEEP